MAAPARIGLFGGSFNPPHLAHLALARLALAHLQLDEVRWLPAGAPWQKPAHALAAPTLRRDMVAALIAGEPGMVLDERELHRQGPSYTLDTVREFQSAQPGAELWLLIGQDQYARLHTWRGAPELLARVRWAVASREGQPVAPPPELAHIPHTAVVLPLPRTDLSATEIRARCAAGAQVDDLAALVGPSVARFLAQHALYQAQLRA